MFMHAPTDPCKEPIHQLKNTKFQQRASIDLYMEASHSFTVFCKSIIYFSGRWRFRDTDSLNKGVYIASQYRVYLVLEYIYK